MSRTFAAAALVGAIAAGGVCQPARSGFITVERRDGCWTFIAPDGVPFRAHGVDWVNYDGFKDARTGRRLYKEANEAQFGGDRALWAADAVKKLKGWGFNALGSGCSGELRHRGLCHDGFLMINEFYQNKPDYLIGPKFPNVFHPEWESFCDAKAKATCAPEANDRDMVGWFFGNESHWWGSGKGVWRYGLFNDAAQLPDSHFAKRALLDYCGGTTNVPDTVKEGFITLCAERFFSVTCGAIRRYDPNHLIIGCRFMGWEGGAISNVWNVAAKYCDVISFNQYPRMTNGVLHVRAEPLTNAIARVSEWSCGRPLLISEWGFMAKDAGLPCTKGAGQVFADQRGRAGAVAEFLREMDACDAVVGHNFFMWVDMPAGGIGAVDGENGNYGLLSADGTPYGPVVDAFRAKGRETP